MENMKQLIKNLYIFSICSATLLACDGALDIKPDDSVDSSSAVETSSDVEALLVGAYSDLGATDIYGGNILRNSELLAATDELTWSGTYTAPRQIYNKNMQVDNDQAEGTWEDAYATINVVNTVLANLDVVDEDLKDQVEGEAKFIRGMLYFDLARFYGKIWIDGDPETNLAVPLVLEATYSITEDSYVSRNTVAEVYTQAISDLTDAASLLPETNGFYATKGAAQAILSRIYLMQHDYANAAEMADNVISSGVYSLNSAYADCFNISSNTSEDIFAMQVTSQDGTNAMNTFFAATDYGGRGDIYIEEAHFEHYDAEDARLALFYEDTDLGGYRTGKWNEQYGNVNIIRLAEMYLTRAEANFKAGSTIGATPLEDINTIRVRAQISELTELTEEVIWEERYKELAFEGHLIHDIKRTERNVGDLTYDDDALVFPIPQREIDANSALSGEQNDGY